MIFYNPYIALRKINITFGINKNNPLFLFHKKQHLDRDLVVLFSVLAIRYRCSNVNLLLA